MPDASHMLTEVPAFLRDLVLGHWPATLVDPMRRCGDAHFDLCKALTVAADDYCAMATEAEASIEGAIRSGLAERHRAVAAVLRNQAALHHSLGMQFHSTADSTLSTQHLLIVAGIVLGAQVTYDMLLFFQGGGFKALADRMAAEAEMRLIAQRFATEVGREVVAGAARRAALHGAVHAAKVGALFGGVTSAGAQAWDLMDGNRKSFDVGAFLEQSAGGALGGVVGAEIGRRVAPRLMGNLVGGGTRNIASLVGRTMVVGGVGGLGGGIAGAVPSLVLHHENIHSLGDLFKAVRDSAITGFGGGFIGAASGALRPPRPARHEPVAGRGPTDFGPRVEALLHSGSPVRIEHVSLRGRPGEAPITAEKLTFGDGTRAFRAVVDTPAAARLTRLHTTGSGEPARTLHVVGRHLFAEAPRAPGDSVAPARSLANRETARQQAHPTEGPGREPPRRGAAVSARGDRPPAPIDHSVHPGRTPGGDRATPEPRVPIAVRYDGQPVSEIPGLAHSRFGDESRHPLADPSPAPHAMSDHQVGDSPVAVVKAQHEGGMGEDGPLPGREPTPFDESVDQFVIQQMIGGGDDIPPPPPPEGWNFEEGDPPNDNDRALADHAFSRLPGADDGIPGGPEAGALLLPMDPSAYRDGEVSAEEFAAHGRAQALNNLAWWRSLSDESIPDGLRARVAQERFEGSGFGLSRLQRAVLRTHPELLTRALGIPDDVAGQASLRVLNARMRTLIAKAESGVGFTRDELMEYARTPQLIDAITMDPSMAVNMRDFDPATGEAAFVFGNAATATKRVYVVTPIHPNLFTSDYHANWMTAKRLYDRMQQMRPDADVAVIAWVRGPESDNAAGDALRGPLLRRDIAVGNAVHQQHSVVDPDLVAAGIELDVAGGHDVITFDHASAAAYAAVGEEGLHTIYTVDPKEGPPPENLPNDVSRYTSNTRKNEPITGLNSDNGPRLAAVDGTRHPARAGFGEPNPMLNVMAKIGLGHDVSRYIPELSDRFGALKPDGDHHPAGNRTLAELGADDVFPIPDGPLDWQTLEGSVRGRLVPVVDAEAGRLNPLDRLTADLRNGIARDDRGDVVPGVVADSYTVVLDNGYGTYRVEMSKIGDEIVVFDPLVSGPLELSRWRELQLHSEVDKAWVIAHQVDGDGVLRPIDDNLHDRSADHDEMPSRPIGEYGVDAPLAERVPGRLTLARHDGLASYLRDVTTGGEIVLGRSAAGATLFEHYGSVSRNHARVGVFRDGRVWIADNGSSRGTFVNGERLTPGEMRVIGPNDIVQLGHDFRTTISFHPERPLVEQQVAAEPDGPVHPGAARPPEPTPAADPPQHFLRLGDEASPIPLSPGDVIPLGREGDPRLPPGLRENDYASRHHAEIKMGEDGRLLVTDTDSTNGTYINGQRIPPREEVPLEPGDTLRIGRFETTVRVENPEAELMAMPPVAFVRSANNDGPPLRLAPGDEVVLGRQEGPLLPRLAVHNSISRRHATIGMDDEGRLWIRDEGSTFGTFVDGEPIPPGQQVPIGDRSVIRLSHGYELTAHSSEVVHELRQPVHDAVAAWPEVFAKPRRLDELLRKMPLTMSFDHVVKLRELSFLRNGVLAPDPARESLDNFVLDLWRNRESIDSWQNIEARAHSSDVRNVSYHPQAFLRELASTVGVSDDHMISLETPTGQRLPAPERLDQLAPDEVGYLHFSRPGAVDGAGTEIAVNVGVDAAPSVLRDLVRNVLGNPDFPGITDIAVKGPLVDRADGIVITINDAGTVQRLVQWLNEYRQDGRHYLFRPDIPAMMHQAGYGIGVMDRTPANNLGEVQARQLFAAMRSTIDGGGGLGTFREKVHELFLRNGIDPMHPYRAAPRR